MGAPLGNRNAAGRRNSGRRRTPRNKNTSHKSSGNIMSRSEKLNAYTRLSNSMHRKRVKNAILNHYLGKYNK